MTATPRRKWIAIKFPFCRMLSRVFHSSRCLPCSSCFSIPVHITFFSFFALSSVAWYALVSSATLTSATTTLATSLDALVASRAAGPTLPCNSTLMPTPTTTMSISVPKIRWKRALPLRTSRQIKHEKTTQPTTPRKNFSDIFVSLSSSPVNKEAAAPSGKVPESKTLGNAAVWSENLTSLLVFKALSW